MNNPIESTSYKYISLKVTLIYTFFSAIWIFLSDQILYFFIKNSELITKIQMMKGWFFILITAAIIFLLLQKEIKKYGQAEKALVESERRYRTLINNTPDILYRTDIEGRITFVSPSIHKLTGYTVDEVIGTKMSEVFQIYSEKSNKFLKVLHQNGRIDNFEAQFKRKNGSTFWVSTNARFYKGEDGCIIGIDCTSRDVTDRKNAEKALFVEKKFTEASLEAQQETFFLFEPLTGKAIRWNRAFSQITGYTNEEISRLKGPDSYYSAEDVIRANNLIEQVFKTGKGTIELDLICKDGRTVTTEYNVSVVNNDEGKPKHFVSIGRDITDRNRAKRILLESEARLNRSQQISHIGNWDWDIKKNVLLWSDELYRIVGLSSFESNLTYDVYIKYIHQDDLENFKKTTKNVLKDKKSYSIGYRIIRTDGSIRFVHERGEVSTDANGNPINLLGTVQDITEQKKREKEKNRLEAQLQQAQKMETIGTLAGGIAHDFNNILSVILGSSQLAKANIHSPEEVKKYIDQIIECSKRSAELVQQILTFSRQSEYQKYPFEIHFEVNQTLKLLRSSIPSTINIKSNINSKATVLADPTKIHQLIMNLCTNAYHSMSNTGGILTVTMTDINISDLKNNKGRKISSGDYLKIEVSDTGHGMDEKTLKRAFDPYFTTKQIGKGTGLGLALVEAIVDEHCGFLEVQSEPEKGTKFYIHLPIVKEKIESNNLPVIPASSLKGYEKIMFVDDELVIGENFKKLFESYGYKVSLFDNGLEAYEEFKNNSHQFDLIITDMTMPGITGDKLATKILKLRPDFPVILCTGFNENISEENSAKIGIKKYVQKPVASQELIALIREIFQDK